MRGFIAPAIFLIAQFITANAAGADDFLAMDVGAYRFNSSTGFKVSGPLGMRGSLQFEEIGTDGPDSRQAVTRVEALVRPFERHRLRFLYLETEPERTITFDRTFRVGGATIPIHLSATAALRLRRVEFDYLYSFWKSDNAEVAFSVGVHQASLRGEFRSPELGISRSTQTSEPLPAIGLLATRRITPNWELTGQIYGMSTRIGKVDGTALAYRVVTRYFFTRNLGVGLGWSGVRYNLESRNRVWNGALDVSNHGSELFVSLRF